MRATGAVPVSQVSVLAEQHVAATLACMLRYRQLVGPRKHEPVATKEVGIHGLHMPAFKGSSSSTCIFVKIFHSAGCRLVLLTSSDMSVAQLQAMVPLTLGSLKQQLLKV